MRIHQAPRLRMDSFERPRATLSSSPPAAPFFIFRRPPRHPVDVPVDYFVSVDGPVTLLTLPSTFFRSSSARPPRPSSARPPRPSSARPPRPSSARPPPPSSPAARLLRHRAPVPSSPADTLLCRRPRIPSSALDAHSFLSTTEASPLPPTTGFAISRHGERMAT